MDPRCSTVCLCSIACWANPGMAGGGRLAGPTVTTRNAVHGSRLLLDSLRQQPPAGDARARVAPRDARAAPALSFLPDPDAARKRGQPPPPITISRRGPPLAARHNGDRMVHSRVAHRPARARLRAVRPCPPSMDTPAAGRSRLAPRPPSSASPALRVRTPSRGTCVPGARWLVPRSVARAPRGWSLPRTRVWTRHCRGRRGEARKATVFACRINGCKV